jgi:hypothetical protein
MFMTTMIYPSSMMSMMKMAHLLNLFLSSHAKNILELIHTHNLILKQLVAQVIFRAVFISAKSVMGVLGYQLALPQLNLLLLATLKQLTIPSLLSDVQKIIDCSILSWMKIIILRWKCFGLVPSYLTLQKLAVISNSYTKCWQHLWPIILQYAIN